LPRTPARDRRASAFKVAPQQAWRELLEEIARFDGQAVIVSTNAPRRRDGRIYTDALDEKLEDPGVAVFFTRAGRRVVFACDTFLTIWENLRALHGTIDALRRIERNGAHQLFDRAFTGFAALPAPDSTPWWTVLGVPQTATVAEINAAWRPGRANSAPPGTRRRAPNSTPPATRASPNARNQAPEETFQCL
jgi:hypothetical protein